MARPGGNPDLVEYQFTTDRSEPLLAKLQLRIAKSMKAQIEAIPNWQEFVRDAIAEKLERNNS